MRFLARRSDALELMDQPSRVTRGELAGSLVGLRRVNRYLGGISLSLRYLGPLIMAAYRAGSNPVRLCDVGTGAGDIPVAVVRWARKRRIPVSIIAVEISPTLAAAARQATRKFPEIHVVEADAAAILGAAAGGGSVMPQRSNLPAPAQPFDVVTANLFLHHFTPDEVIAWLALMRSAARQGVVVNDLERAFWPWLGIRTLGWVLCRNRVFLHDAPLSVRRAYTVEEWRTLARRAGLREVRVQAHSPGRVVVRGA